MPAKKGKTGKPKAKKDMMDFFKDASRPRSTVGPKFLQVIGKRGLKTKDLYEQMVDWGYDGVCLEDVTKLLKIYKSSDRLKNFVTDTAY
jgi:hypothetical protein